MHDFDLVHGAKTSHCLNKDLPNLPLFDVSFLLFVVADFLEDIPVIGQLHDNTEITKLE